MNKKDREKIKRMFGEKCAFCGGELPEKGWHVEHVKPIFRGWKEEDKPAHAGTDTIDNMMPACKRCNLWKKTMTVEQFRGEIAAQPGRLTKYSAGFRLAIDYGIVEQTLEPIKFYFERV